MINEKDGRGSKGQDRIWDLLKQIYPKYNLIWEQPIKSINARFDIFVKELGIAIEIDGEQHNKFNTFFHKDMYALQRGVHKDRNKDSFCYENGIKLIRLNYKDALTITLDSLKERIENTEYPDGIFTFSCLS